MNTKILEIMDQIEAESPYPDNRWWTFRALMASDIESPNTTFDVPNVFVEDYIQRFTKSTQLDVLIEECGRLVMAASRLRRQGNTPRTKQLLKEAIASVLMMLAVISHIFGVSREDVETEILQKAQKYSLRVK